MKIYIIVKERFLEESYYYPSKRSGSSTRETIKAFDSLASAKKSRGQRGGTILELDLEGGKEIE